MGPPSPVFMLTREPLKKGKKKILKITNKKKILFYLIILKFSLFLIFCKIYKSAFIIRALSNLDLDLYLIPYICFDKTIL